MDDTAGPFGAGGRPALRPALAAPPRSGEDLGDRSPGGSPIHALLGWEVEAILALAEQWGPIDRSHRKLAHRGSYLQRVWVAPSTVRRVLAAADVNLPAPPRRPAPRQRRPWREWVLYRPNHVWGYDATHFSRCRAAPNCFAIIDLVSRTWISTLLSAEETATQTQVVFLDALEAQNLIGRIEQGVARIIRLLGRRSYDIHIADHIKSMWGCSLAAYG